jgi:hypothetical protein
MKEYGMYKPTYFNEDYTKIKTLQECFVYLKMNRDFYDQQTKDWLHLVLHDWEGCQSIEEALSQSIKDLDREKLVYFTFNMFLNNIQKAFQSTDRIQDAVTNLKLYDDCWRIDNQIPASH